MYSCRFGDVERPRKLKYCMQEYISGFNLVRNSKSADLTQLLSISRGLKVIEEDLEELQVFLNNSYHANEFYIRDIVGFVIYVFDELSIKSHIESLPAIVSEIWEVMGDTGKKIQKSILWVIEKVSI